MTPLDGMLIDEDKDVVQPEPEVGLGGGVIHTEVFEMTRNPESEEEFLAWYTDKWAGLENKENIEVHIEVSEHSPYITSIEYQTGYNEED